MGTQNSKSYLSTLLRKSDSAKSTKSQRLCNIGTLCEKRPEKSHIDPGKPICSLLHRKTCKSCGSDNTFRTKFRFKLKKNSDRSDAVGPHHVSSSRSNSTNIYLPVNGLLHRSQYHWVVHSQNWRHHHSRLSHHTMATMLLNPDIRYSQLSVVFTYIPLNIFLISVKQNGCIDREEFYVVAFPRAVNSSDRPSIIPNNNCELLCFLPQIFSPRNSILQNFFEKYSKMYARNL